MAAVTLFNLAWITALLNQADSSKRFRPMANSGGIRNVVTTRDTPNTREFNAGGREFVSDKARTFEGLVTGSAASPRHVGIINGFRCKPHGVYIIDRAQNLIGVLSTTTGSCDVCTCNSDYQNTGIACSATMRDPYNLIWIALYADDGTRNGIELAGGEFLYPIPVDQESVYAMLEFNDGKNQAQDIKFMLDFTQDFKDQTLSMIPCGSFVGFQPSMIRGLVDVCATVNAIETTGATITLKTGDRDAINKTLTQGLVRTDFVWTNTSNNNSVIPLETAGFQESSPGVYVFDFLAASEPTLGNELKLTITKNGYDFSCVTNEVIAVPNS